MGRLLLLFALAMAAVSCVPTSKLTYLQQEIKQDSVYYDLVRSDYQVQPNDILNINVRTFDEQTAQIFNIQGENNRVQAGEVVFYLQGYSVDREGYIDIPVLGKVEVQGKDTEEIKSLVQEKLDEYFKEGSTHVSVQLAGVKFSVLGEVARPGRYVIYQNQVNIFEALASSGDITLVGDRDQVTIVRQQKEGVVMYHMDLTDADVLSDPKFFIQPNDIIYVEPLPQRSLGIGTTGFQTFASIVGVMASTITLIIAISNLQ